MHETYTPRDACLKHDACLALASRRHAFGKTSIASTGDIDFFLPDTGPLSTESYRKRLTTSMGTKQIKLPKSGVQVRKQGSRPAAIEAALCP
jgi:hypothetical protein